MGRRRSRPSGPADPAPSLPRSAAAVLVTGSATAGFLAVLERQTDGPVGLDDAVALAVVGVGAVAAAVLTCGSLLLLLSAVAALAGRSSAAVERLARAVTPAVLRRAVAVTIGAGVGLGMATPAMAEEVDLGWAPTGTTQTRILEVPQAAEPATPGRTDPPAASATQAPRGTPAPAPREAPVHTTTSRTTEAGTDASTASAPVSLRSTSTSVPRTSSTGARASTTATDDVVVVAAGDSLWSIASSHLPDGSTPSEIAAAWPRWYEANRQAVGADPDLIRPGLELRIPDSADVPQEDS